MAIRAVRIRRVVREIGTTDEQADEFVEAMDDYATKQDLLNALEAMEHRIVNRLLIALMATAALIIGAVALLTQL